jgi:hypothetical protein
MNLTVHMPARKGTDMKAEKTEERKRQEGGELIQFVQTCAGELLKGTSLSVLSPYLLHYKITFTIKGSVGEGDFLVHYDWDNQHLEFQVRLSRIVPKEHIERAVRLLNLINIESSCVNFIILQESGQVGLSLNMFLGDNLVSRAKIRKAIPGAVKKLSPLSLDKAASAIMTTDTVPKVVYKKIKISYKTK